MPGTSLAGVDLILTLEVLQRRQKNPEPYEKEKQLLPAIPTSFPRSGTRSEHNFSRETLQGIPCLVSKFSTRIQLSKAASLSKCYGTLVASS